MGISGRFLKTKIPIYREGCVLFRRDRRGDSIGAERDRARKHCGTLARGNEIRNRDGTITKKAEHMRDLFRCNGQHL